MRIGIDLGGTKIEGLALLDDGTEAVRRRVATPPAYAETVEALAGLVDAIEREVGERGTVGLCIPGAIDAETNTVKNANSTWLNGRPFRDDLTDRLGRAVRMTNDANAFALSEASDGAGAGAEAVFGVILGTGVGGGIVVRGEVLDGANRIAGEWGHVPLPWPEGDERPGPPCYCGKRGCVETFLSGPSFARDHERHTGEALSTARDRRPRRGRRPRRAGEPRPLRRPPRARAGAARDDPRPRRGRARRRDVEPAPVGGACRGRAEAVGVLRPRRHARAAERPRRLQRRARSGLAVASSRVNASRPRRGASE